MKKLLQLTCLFVFAHSAFAQKAAMHFDGVNDYIPITGTSKLNSMGKITLETWVYVTNSASSPCADCAPVIWNQQNSYRLATGNTKKVTITILNGTTPVTLISAGTINDKQWVHIAATFNGTKLKLYIDGVATDSLATSTFNIAYASSTAAVWIVDPVTGYGGILEETRLWDYARNTQQIQEGMSRRYASNEPGLILQLSYEDGTPYADNTSVSVIKDNTSYSHNGTPGNFTLKDSSSNFVLGRSYCDTTAYAKFSVTRCIKYQLPSKKKTVTISGVYQDTVSSYRGCDSVMTITVKINKPSSATVYLSGCDSVQSPLFFSYYKKSGKYNVTITNYLGCDSTIAFFVTVYKKDTTKINHDACVVADLGNGKTVSKSGIYVDSLKGFRGCDSFVIHTVTIRNASTASATLYLCNFVGSPTDPDQVYRKPGIYYDTIPNYDNCDSIIEYTVLSTASSGIVNVQSCGNYKSPSGRYTWTGSGTYYDTLFKENAKGCDSFMTINLSIVPPVQKTLNITQCRSYIVPSGSKTITGSGTHSDVIKSQGGCDSIQYTLNVTINNANTNFTRSGNTLTASSGTSGATFQWLHCDNQMTALSGETNKSFMPLANGSYALEETESNCTDTSACYVFQFNGTRGSTLQDIGIFPNPATNRLSITSPQILRDARIGIYNATGQRMREWEYSGFNRAELELALPQGFYLLRIQSAQGSLTKSLLVE